MTGFFRGERARVGFAAAARPFLGGGGADANARPFLGGGGADAISARLFFFAKGILSEEVLLSQASTGSSLGVVKNMLNEHVDLTCRRNMFTYLDLPQDLEQLLEQLLWNV